MRRLQAAKAKTSNATRSMIRKLLSAQQESDAALQDAAAEAKTSSSDSQKSILKNRNGAR
jgi:PBP1b-binding outer membrane lipoprotein LpoB